MKYWTLLMLLLIAGLVDDGFAQLLPREPQVEISVTSPASGDTLFVGTTATIKFQIIGTPQALSLQYSTNAGLDWKIFGNVGGGNSYAWVVPNTPTTQAIIRILDKDGSVGESGVFSIVASGKITSFTIQGEPDVYGDSTAMISWTDSGDVGNNVDLDLSYDNRVTWFPIVQDLLLNGITSYLWHTPSFGADGAIIRGSFRNGVVVYSAPFTIHYFSGVAETPNQAFPRPFPNPASRYIFIPAHLKPGSEPHVLVYSVDGLLSTYVDAVRQEDGALRLDVSRLSPETYLYEVRWGASAERGFFTIGR